MKYFLALLVLGGVLACAKAPMLYDAPMRITGKEESKGEPGVYEYTVSGKLQKDGYDLNEFRVQSIQDWNVGDTLLLKNGKLSKKHSFPLEEYLDMSEKTQDTIFVKWEMNSQGDSVIVKISSIENDTVR